MAFLHTEVVHILTYHQQKAIEKDVCFRNPEMVIDTFDFMKFPIFLTTVTTSLGFLINGFSDIEIIFKYAPFTGYLAIKYFFQEYVRRARVITNYEIVDDNELPISRKNKSQGLNRMDEFKKRLREQEKSNKNNWNDQ